MGRFQKIANKSTYTKFSKNDEAQKGLDTSNFVENHKN